MELLFFVFPFLRPLVAAVARAPYADWLPRALAVTLVGLATLFAAIGLYQAWSHTLIFAQDLRVANAYTTYFRVTSLFKDPTSRPSSRARDLACSSCCWLARVRLAYALVLVAVLFGGLYFSYSQSSMVVLFVTLLAATILLADRHSRNLVIAVAIAFAILGGAFALVSAKDTGLRRATSGRSRLISLTTTVIRNHPVVGAGIGSQPLAARREVKTRRPADKNASHTTPLTVFAELGVIGFGLYLLFLAFLVETTKRRRALGLGLSVVFLVLFLHSLFYSGFFEDPIMWGAVAVAALVAAGGWRLDPPAGHRHLSVQAGRGPLAHLEPAPWPSPDVETRPPCGRRLPRADCRRARDRLARDRALAAPLGQDRDRPVRA